MRWAGRSKRRRPGGGARATAELVAELDAAARPRDGRMTAVPAAACSPPLRQRGAPSRRSPLAPGTGHDPAGGGHAGRPGGAVVLRGPSRSGRSARLRPRDGAAGPGRLRRPPFLRPRTPARGRGGRGDHPRRGRCRVGSVRCVRSRPRPTRSARSRQIRVDLGRLDALMKQVGELVVAKNRLTVHASDGRRPGARRAQRSDLAAGLGNAGGGASPRG